MPSCTKHTGGKKHTAKKHTAKKHTAKKHPAKKHTVKKHRNKRHGKTMKKNKMKGRNRWMDHVQSIREKHKGISLKDALKKAKITYKK